MSKKKKNPRNAGRKPIPEQNKRVHFSTRIAPETKEKIEKAAGAMKVGRWLDKHFLDTPIF